MVICKKKVAAFFYAGWEGAMARTNALKKDRKITWKEIKRQKTLLIISFFVVIYGVIFYYWPLTGWPVFRCNVSESHQEYFLYGRSESFDNYRYGDSFRNSVK